MQNDKLQKYGENKNKCEKSVDYSEYSAYFSSFSVKLKNLCTFFYFSRVVLMFDPEITQHNLCKKLSQLHKVIQYLLVNLDEQRYQISILSNEYKTNEKVIFDNYETNVNRIMNTANVGLNIDSIHKSYYRKFDIIKTGFNHYNSENINEFNTWEKTIQQTIGALVAELTEIYKEIDTNLSAISDKFSKFNTELAQGIKDKAFQCKKEIAAIDKESRNRYNQLQAESDDKISKIMKANEQKLNEESSKIRASTPLPGMGRKSGISQKNRINVIREKLLTSSKNVSAIENTHKNNIIGFRSRLRNLLEQMTDSGESGKKEDENFSNLLESIDGELKAEIFAIQNERDDKRRANEQEIKNLKKELADEDKKFRIEYDHLGKLYDKDLLGHNSQASTLLQQFTNERTQLQNELRKEESSLNISINEITQDIAIFKERADEILAKLVRKDAELKNSLENLAEEEEEKYKNLLNEFKADLESELKSKTAEYEESKKNNNEFSNQEKEKKKLKATLSGLIGTFHAKMATINDDENAEIGKMKNSFTTNFANESRKYDAEYGSLKAQQDIKLSIALQQIEREELEFEAKLNGVDVQKEFKMEDSDELQKIKLEYEKEYEKLENEYKILCEPPPPVSPTAKSQISTTNHINYLNAEKQKKLDLFSSEKESLLSGYKKDFDQYNKRPPTRSGSNDNLDFKLNQYKMKMLSNLVQFDNTIASLLSDLKKEKQKGIDIMVASDDSEIDTLKKQLQKAQNSSQEKINKSQSNYDKEIKSLKDEIDKESEAKKTECAAVSAACESEIVQLRSEEQKLIERKRGIQKAYEANYRSMIDSAKKRTEEILVAITDLKTSRVSKLEDAMDRVKREADYHATDLKEKEKFFKGQLKLEKERLMIEKEKSNQLKNKMSYESKEIEEAQRKLDELKQKVTLRGMRAEEQSVIDQLTETLHAKTQYLIMVGRDMLDYRSRLIEQEQEVNARFGHEPLVSLGAQNINAKRPLTAMSTVKKLPRLSTPNFD